MRFLTLQRSRRFRLVAFSWLVVAVQPIGAEEMLQVDSVGMNVYDLDMALDMRGPDCHVMQIDQQ